MIALDKNLIDVREVPEWMEQKMDRKPHRNTVRRWYTTGVEGRVLETIKLGKTVFTNAAAIEAFARS